MKTVQELIDRADPGFPLIQEWVRQAAVPAVLLPPSKERERVLAGLQISTRSTMGAMAYESGGMLVDGGWLRLLGSSHPKLMRNLVDWNKGKGKGFWLVADDVLGGCFAVNSGGLGTDAGALYFFAPDSLRWEPMSMGYSQFLQWALGGGLQDFYVDLRWPNWQSDVVQVRGDDCFNFYPPLWTREGGVVKSRRKVIGIGEQYRQQIDAARQLDVPVRN